MNKITACKFAHSSDMMQVDDIIYLPQGNALHPRRERNRGVTLSKEPWVQEIIGKQHGITVFFFLKEAYTRYRMRSNAEPEWINRLFPREQTELRRHFVLTDGVDPFAICPVVPFTGMGYIVLEDGLVRAICDALPINRLQGIRQLGFLHDPVIRQERSSVVSFLFNHTRYCHSLDAMAIGTLIGRNIGLDKQQMRTLRVGCFTHDIMTPAGGDTTKLVDPKVFNEERLYSQLFQKYAESWAPVKKAYHLDEHALIDMVAGKGLFGRLLDIADKTAYVARDANAYLQRCQFMRYEWEGRLHIASLINRRPRICSLWDAVGVEKEKVFFTDAERLYDFLMLRALLFRDLYYNPASRALETLVSKVLIQYLYERGRLTQDTLLEMQDWQLDECFVELTGRPFFLSSDMGDPRVEVFSTPEAAAAREAKLGLNIVSFVETFRNATNPGTKFLLRERGVVKPFRDAYPDEAAKIESVMTCKDPVRLYYLPLSNLKLPVDLEDKIRQQKEQRLLQRKPQKI